MTYDNWLRCLVFRGFFSDEVAVEVAPKSGERSSFIVSRDQVEGDPDQEGKVRVKVYRDGETAWAVLPTDNQTVIPVNDADLMPI